MLTNQKQPADWGGTRNTKSHQRNLNLLTASDILDMFISGLRNNSNVPNALFDVVPENLPEIVLRTGARLHHLHHALRLQKDVVVALNGVLERLIGHDLGLSLQKALK